MKRREIGDLPVFRFLRVLGDLMAANWLWILCSLPIVTIGPATCALFTVTLKLAKDEPFGLLRTWFNAFRENFKRGLVIGLGAIALLIVAVTDFIFALGQGVELLRKLFIVVSVVVLCVLLTVICYTFALQARFSNSLKGHIKNTFLLAVCCPGWTILMAVIYVLPILGLIFWPEMFLYVLGFLYLMMGISGPTFLASFVLKHVFARFGDQEQELPEEDNWTLEE